MTKGGGTAVFCPAPRPEMELILTKSTHSILQIRSNVAIAVDVHAASDPQMAELWELQERDHEVTDGSRTSKKRQPVYKHQGGRTQMEEDGR